jgi:hypothetical protein
MITVAQARKIDPNLANMSDEELELAIKELYENAQLGFEVWWIEKSSTNPVGSFPDPRGNDKI